jgi:hypothetical protein
VITASPNLQRRQIRSSSVGAAAVDDYFITKHRTSCQAKPIDQPGKKVLHRRGKFRFGNSGCYYWIVDEMERAGHQPHLAHALTAKRRMEGRHKTNDRDAKGLAMLLRNGWREIEAAGASRRTSAAHSAKRAETTADDRFGGDADWRVRADFM